MKNAISRFMIFLLGLGVIQNPAAQQRPGTAGAGQTLAEEYQYPETRELVQLVKDASELLQAKGRGAFEEFRTEDSRWRRGETYVFVLDAEGNMLVHPDKTMEGKNQLDLKDVNGKPIIRGIIAAATTFASKPEGWYHYQWPVPGGLLPRWKSTYARLATDGSGASYIVGSGVYNDRMERSFVIDLVKDAVGQMEKKGEGAFPLFRDPAGPFAAKETYVFVIDVNGIDLVNPAFPNLEGRNILDVKDTEGKALVREIVDVVQSRGAGWVDYMWPKPGESVSTLKSTYVSTARAGDRALIVGCGVYLSDAPKARPGGKKASAPELIVLVREGAALLEEKGEEAFADFREKGSKWFHEETYFFVRTMDERMMFHAANPALEGKDMSGVTDVRGRRYGRMFHEAAISPAAEGWVHYMYPEPGNIFPTWKSTFVKRVNLPSGKQCILCCGIYNMEMDEVFIKDIVDRAATLLAEQGKQAFPQLRDKTGPYCFLDTYVFVDGPDGTELVNAGQPSLEGKNLMDLRDVHGKAVTRDYIEAAMKEDSAWVDYYWYKPGHNTPARKRSYVRKVQCEGDTYIVGSGYYPAENGVATRSIQKTSWSAVERERLSDSVSRQMISGEKATLAQYFLKAGAGAARHSHASEEYMSITSGTMKYIFDDREVVVGAGDIITIPPNTPHSVVALEETVSVGFFAPYREDWTRGEDQYLRR